MSVYTMFARFFLTLCVVILSGCTNQRVLTTLAVDRSASNINNTDNRKNVVDICKFLTSKIKDTDTLVIKEFDSQPRPSKLDDFLDRPNAKKRTQFKENRCPTILPSQPAAGVSPGTDIRSVWIEHYKDYDRRKKEDNNKNQGKVIEVALFYIDYLEPVSQLKEQISISNTFETSIEEFIKDGNFIVIFIVNQEDRELIGSELNLVSDLEKRLTIANPNTYRQIIEELYIKAKTKAIK